MYLLSSMIYLIITTCILNRVGIQDAEKRKERYLYAISETLQHLPATIRPVIVENNGKRSTYLDEFYHNGKIVPVIYTNNNNNVYRSKAVNELLDIKEVIHQMGMNHSDMVIKVTGRYRITSPLFFNEVIEYQGGYDAFLKCYGVVSLEYDENECVLGLYAVRCRYLAWMPTFYMNSFQSSERLFIKYIRSCGMIMYKMEQLDMECCFGEDNRMLLL